MEQSLDRLKGFSDAFIAIIITLMVLEIPLPQDMNQIELLSFAKALLIYVASFLLWRSNGIVINVYLRI